MIAAMPSTAAAAVDCPLCGGRCPMAAAPPVRVRCLDCDRCSDVTHEDDRLRAIAAPVPPPGIRDLADGTVVRRFALARAKGRTSLLSLSIRGDLFLWRDRRGYEALLPPGGAAHSLGQTPIWAILAASIIALAMLGFHLLTHRGEGIQIEADREGLRVTGRGRTASLPWWTIERLEAVWDPALTVAEKPLAEWRRLMQWLDATGWYDRRSRRRPTRLDHGTESALRVRLRGGGDVGLLVGRGLAIPLSEAEWLATELERGRELLVAAARAPGSRSDPG
jgi:hypothetical protein